MNIFFDLDGTILDISDRLYLIYSDILRYFAIEPITKEKFWQLKRNGQNISGILSKNQNEILVKEYKEKFLGLIENSNYLNLDILSQENKKILERLNDDSKLYLVTLRKNQITLEWQLEKKGLINLFEAIYFNIENVENKFEILKNVKGIQNSFLVGDTRQDIKDGKQLGMKTIAISSGLESKELLKKENPDFLISDLKEIYEIFKPKN